MRRRRPLLRGTALVVGTLLALLASGVPSHHHGTADGPESSPVIQAHGHDHGVQILEADVRLPVDGGSPPSVSTPAAMRGSAFPTASPPPPHRFLVPTSRPPPPSRAARAPPLHS